MTIVMSYDESEMGWDLIFPFDFSFCIEEYQMEVWPETRNDFTENKLGSFCIIPQIISFYKWLSLRDVRS